MTRRLPIPDDVALHEVLLKRASHAAKNALITSAIAFGRRGGAARGVLFAVAQTYAICTRDVRAAEWAGTPFIEVDAVHALRRQLARSEEQLCAAAAALSEFGRNAIGHLLRAASEYVDAWEAERCCSSANLVVSRRNAVGRAGRNRFRGPGRQVSTSG